MLNNCLFIAENLLHCGISPKITPHINNAHSVIVLASGYCTSRKHSPKLHLVNCTYPAGTLAMHFVNDMSDLCSLDEGGEGGAAGRLYA